MERFDKLIGNLISPLVGRPTEEIEPMIELPPQLQNGDRAIPCFRWAKEKKTSPAKLAEKFKKQIEKPGLPNEIERIETKGGYLNFFLRRSVLTGDVLKAVHDQAGQYGFVQKDPAPVAVIEFSAPNIAKPFSIGHLRSTNIGAALSRIFSARGWNVIRINHIGDWGTQFGKVMAAYRRWGKAEQLGEDPIANLYKLYVRFHEEEVSDPTLIEEGREWFVRLEKGDEEATELWQWFRDLTLMELKRLYKELGIEFDHYWGESFYKDHLGDVLAELSEKRITTLSDEATIVDLEEHGLPTCIVKKSDDSSLYLTRDLAAAKYRKEHLDFSKMIYVVGAPQQIHFKQLFKILELMGDSWAKDCEHVSFGHISFGDEAMSTRKGNVVFLSDVLKQVVELAQKIVEEKNPELENKAAVAHDIGLGAILFADLSSKRIKDVRFSWEDILSFDGETGPYLQYTLVRTKSVIRRYSEPIDADADPEKLDKNEEVAIIRHLAMFPRTLARAEREREPFLISQYLVDLARLFNHFYQVHRILDAEDEIKRARMLLVYAVSDVMATGLTLLGVPTPEKM